MPRILLLMIWFFFAFPGLIDAQTDSNIRATKSGDLPAPVFSHPGGFYDSGFDLHLSTDVEGAAIRFTLDGSEPDVSAQPYTGPIRIDSRAGEPNDISMIPTNDDPNPGPPYFEGWQPPAEEVFKVNIVRARLLQPGSEPGPVSTHTFLVDEKGANRYSLPVISITTNRENFFDDEIGIYVPGVYNNYFQRGREWERPAHMEFFEIDGSLAFAQDIGVRTHGGTTRKRPRKSLRIYARSDYGEPWIDYQLFPDKPVARHKRFLLRNSGNDWDITIFRDAFMQSLFKDMNVDIQYFRPAVVFINGEYWGIHSIRDRFDERYVEAHYGIAEEEMVMLENNAVFDSGNEAGRRHYLDLIDLIGRYTMQVQPFYDSVAVRLDVDSFIDQNIAHIFVMNTDWPGNNLLYWRRIRNGYDPDAPPGLDGRWRWMVFDTDFGFGLPFFYVPGVDERAAHNTLAMATATDGPSWPNPPWSTLILRRLLANEGFRHQFINRFADVLNTSFRHEHVVARIDSIRTLLEPEMQEHIDRWRRPTSMQEWHANVEVMRGFARERPGHVRQHINEKFSLGGTAEVTLRRNGGGGHIKINTIQPDLSTSWTGTYFRNVPVRFQAVAAPGYRFSGWTGTYSGEAESIVTTLTGDVTLTAHFEETGDFPGDEMHPAAHRLGDGPYVFDFWSENEPEGSFPPNMIFQQSEMDDPELDDEMTAPYHVPEHEYHEDDAASIGFPYRLTRRTRLNGLGGEGISFINTGRGRDLGAAVLALDTRSTQDVTVSWTGGTITPNSRTYGIRLQYRIGVEEPFRDVLDDEGRPVEYSRSAIEHHAEEIEPAVLPSDANNRPYVQLRWKYYYTGIRLTDEHGRRDELRLDDIRVTADPVDVSTDPDGVPERFQLGQNYPNPFNPSTTFRYALPEQARVRLVIFDVLGRQVSELTDAVKPAGDHTVTWHADVPSGVYFYWITASAVTDGAVRFSATGKMVVLR